MTPRQQPIDTVASVYSDLSLGILTKYPQRKHNIFCKAFNINKMCFIYKQSSVIIVIYDEKTMENFIFFKLFDKQIVI